MCIDCYNDIVILFIYLRKRNITLYSDHTTYFLERKYVKFSGFRFASVVIINICEYYAQFFQNRRSCAVVQIVCV